jgi:hypothetical protein
MLLRSSLYSRLFRANSEPLLCLTRTNLKIFPAKKILKTPLTAEFFRKVHFCTPMNSRHKFSARQITNLLESVVNQWSRA